MLTGQVALAVGSAVLVVAADQASKAAVQRLSLENPAHDTAIRVKVVRSQNAGIGRLTVPRAVAVTSGLVVITLALAAIGLVSLVSTATVVGLGVAVGGAAGNLADLLVRGYVVDFISIGRWPVFNLADVALCVGVGLTFLGLR